MQSVTCLIVTFVLAAAAAASAQGSSADSHRARDLARQALSEMRSAEAALPGVLTDAKQFRLRFEHPLERTLSRMMHELVDRSCIMAARTLLSYGRALRGDPSKDWQRDQRMKYRAARASCQRSLQNPF